MQQSSQKSKNSQAIGGVLIGLGALFVLGAIGAIIYMEAEKNKKPIIVEKKPEVFLYQPGVGKYSVTAEDAVDVAAADFPECALATRKQLTDAYKAGADWCQGGWTIDDDGSLVCLMPLQTPKKCANQKTGVVMLKTGSGLADLTLYGIKPDESGTYGNCMDNPGVGPCVMPFNFDDGIWSRWN